MILKAFDYQGHSIAYNLEGFGQCVVLIHGFLENNTMWSGLVAKLKRHYAVLTVDLPGHGNSDAIGEIQSMEEMADVVSQLIANNNLKYPIVIGHSMGGYVGLAMAENAKIKAMCLLNSTFLPDSSERKAGRMQAVKMAEVNHKSFIRHSIPMLFRYKNRIGMRSTVNAVKAEALRTSQLGVTACLKGMRARPDRAHVLTRSGIQAHMIIGGKDPVISAKDILANIPTGVTYDLLPESGHMSIFEERALCEERILGFLDRIKA